MLGPTLLVVEDEQILRSALERGLGQRGFTVSLAASSREAQALLETQCFDAAIIDRSLPDGDGAMLCRARRSEGDTTPFVLFTGLDSPQDVLDGYGAEADLYLRKPMGMAELSAHVLALLRRFPRSEIVVGPIVVDSRRSVLGLPEDKSHPLARQELTFLASLARQVDHVVSRDVLVESVWGTEEPDSNGLDVLAWRLRRKLGGLSWMLETVRGRGFRLRRRPKSSRRNRAVRR